MVYTISPRWNEQWESAMKNKQDMYDLLWLNFGDDIGMIIFEYILL